MKKLLILKTGRTVEPLQQTGKDFEDWIITGSEVDADLFQTIEVSNGESLPGFEVAQGIYVTGSPAFVTDRAQWSEQTAAYLKGAVSESIPILGICYGHQLLAHSFGGRIDFHPHGREIGTVAIELTEAARSDPLMGRLPEIFQAQVSHQQSVIQLPDNAVRLAFNGFEANHGFRIGNCAWGVQFHPEFSEETVAAYIKHRKQSIANEGLSVGGLLGSIKPTPEATSLLRKFAELCLQG